MSKSKLQKSNMQAIKRWWLMERLGLPKKLPKDFKKNFALIYIQGRFFDISVRESRVRKHRVHMKCPLCGRWIQCGKFHQHDKACK